MNKTKKNVRIKCQCRIEIWFEGFFDDYRCIFFLAIYIYIIYTYLFKTKIEFSHICKQLLVKHI
jgi:hypothetical protein